MQNTKTILFTLCASVALLAVEPFQGTIQVKNGQVRELHFGWQNGATNEYDTGVDIVIPPFGMGSGIVGFQQSATSKDRLYKDLRAPRLPQEWLLFADPLRSRRPVVLSWDPALLPKDISFQLQVQNRTILMSQNNTVSVKEQGIIRIRAEKKEQSK